MPVGIHHLRDSGMTEPGLYHLRVQVGSDQRWGLEVTQLPRPCSLLEAVRRISTCLAAPVVSKDGAGVSVST
jgi:MOSC domain-containing protein YiiM